VTQSLKLAAACLILILGAFVLPSSAQQTTELALQPFSPAPYRTGERLTYNISFSNFISAAHVEMLVASRGMFYGREAIELKGHVETSGVVSAALFAINNDYTTYVDPASGLPFRSEQKIREGSRIAEALADFSPPAGTVAVTSKRMSEVAGMYDYLAAIYRLRALPLSIGSTYTVVVRNENQNYQVEIRVTGRENIKSNVGSFNAIVSQVRIRDESQSTGYNLKAYFSDEQRHVPLLIIARLPAGEIQIELAGSSFVTAPVATPTPTPAPVASAPTHSPVTVAPAPVTDESEPDDLPFKVGEQLNYQVFLPNISTAVGTATFQVRARSKYFDHDGLLFTVNAQTTNALQKVFVANDTMSSYVDAKSLLPFRTELNLNEGQHRSVSKLTINQDYGTATTESGERIEIPIGTHDYLSYFYVVRTFNLSPSKRNAISILVNNKPKTLFISALQRENVQIGSQTIPAIQISLTTDDVQGDKFQIRGWISDDKRRLPLRLTAVTELGMVRADLVIIPVTPQ
jgi:hypothetical protein